MEIKPMLLVVDDESAMRESYKILLEDHYTLVFAVNGREAVETVQKEPVNLVLLDILLPDMDGIEVLRKIKGTSDVEVIMVTAVKTMRTAIQAVKLGAYDYISKPFDIDDLLATVGKALEKQHLTREILYLRSELSPCVFGDMIGVSFGMKQVFSVIHEISSNESTVLITGESGTGKELIARAIHRDGVRRDRPFVAVDCAAIPENLVESEFFGHEKGAFTDATSLKLGKFELANGGTLFLDEVGNLPMDIQCKMLRVLEEREIQRVGGMKNIKVDTRIISATNIDLKKAVADGKFRQDLYYRLNVIPLHVPPLRERKEDIPLLVDHFIALFNKRFGKDIQGISKEALELFTNYGWPGNVRELRNVVERLVVLNKEKVITHRRLPFDMLLAENDKPAGYYDKVSLHAARDEFEKQFILKVLEKVNWNQTKASKLLGIHRNALLYKIRQFELRPILTRSRLLRRQARAARR
jgi:DNA-binding NtrC family response regulator